MANTDKKIMTYEFPHGRKNTSMWLEPKIHKSFIEACRLTGRKSCDIVEAFENAYVSCVKKEMLNQNPCLVKPIIINLTLNLKERYDRGRKMEKEKVEPDPVVYCPRANGRKTYIWGPHTFTCKFECKYGERKYEWWIKEGIQYAKKHSDWGSQNTDRSLCETYVKAKEDNSHLR